MKIKLIQVIFLGLTLLLQSHLSAQPVTWKEAKKNGTATLDVYWYISNPFIYKNNDGKLLGVEVELLESLQSYVKEKHQVDLKLNWIEDESFDRIMNRLSTEEKPNAFGASAFSITDQRKEKLKFTNPYLTDVTVLVSSKGTPIVRTLGEINKMIKKMTAVSIKGTTYEQFILELKKQLNLDFNIMYIKADENILEEIEKKDDRFGFIDLPIYLMLIKKGGRLTRQNFFTIKGDGYGFLTHPSSDWTDIFNEFLASREGQKKLAAITSKYMGEELYYFIKSLNSDDNLGASILTKEKEIQLEHLENTNLLLAKEKSTQAAYSIIAVITTVLLTIIIILFYREQKVSKILQRKNKQIEEQQRSIEKKNQQLNNRNLKLTSLNEEKNNLVKILAHDLKSPINQITGLLEVLKLTQKQSNAEEEKIIKQAQDSATRLNQMISKILDFDALEGTHMKVQIEEIDVKELLFSIEKELQLIANKKGTSILYSTEEDLRLKADHLFLTQILENIILNAIKFSEPSSKIEVGAESKEDQCIFFVKDEGPGLTEEDKSIIFKNFQKLSAQPTSGEGSTGLGLSIVKKYVDLLHGKVWVESELGKGSTFFVSIPKSL
jgi:signal transduction histidine kinase